MNLQTRSLRLCLLLLTVVFVNMALLAPAAVWAQTEEEDAFDKARAAFRASETKEERLEIVNEFLANHRDHPRVGTVIGVGADVLLHGYEDRTAAVKLVENEMARITDAEVRADLHETLLDLYSDPAYADKLAALVGEMFDAEEMSYVDHLNVIRAASAAEAWTLVNDHAATAAPLATPAAFRAAYPDYDFSDEYIEEAGTNRQGLLKTYTGWAAANTGDTKQALAEFQEARTLVRETFMGLPENELYRFWGQTLVQAGKTKKGLQKLALAAVFGVDHEAEEAARETFAEMGKKPEDFEDYLWKLRVHHAPKMLEFSALDYSDASHSFNSLRGKKATLLAFWFPT